MLLTGCPIVDAKQQATATRPIGRAPWRSWRTFLPRLGLALSLSSRLIAGDGDVPSIFHQLRPGRLPSTARSLIKSFPFLLEPLPLLQSTFCFTRVAHCTSSQLQLTLPAKQQAHPYEPHLPSTATLLDKRLFQRLNHHVHQDHHLRLSPRLGSSPSSSSMLVSSDQVRVGLSSPEQQNFLCCWAQ